MDKSAFVRPHSRSPRIYPSPQTVYLQVVTVKLHLGNAEKCTTDASLLQLHSVIPVKAWNGVFCPIG